MVAFRRTMGGYEVLVNEQSFGYISKDRGFFTGPTSIRCFTEVSVEDFGAIQEKIGEVVGLSGHVSAETAGDRKERALMIIIETMIGRYQNSHRDNLDEGIFRLFEKAKRVRYAPDSRALTEAIKDI